MAWSARLHTGGHVNVLLPAFALLILLFGRAAHRLETRDGVGRWQILPDAAGLADPGVRIPLLRALCVVQFLLLIYDPTAFVPSGEDERAGNGLVEELAAVGGSAWLPSHGYLAERAGGKMLAHKIAMLDLMRGGDRELSQKLDREIRESIAERRWALILQDTNWYQAELAQHYRAEGTVFSDGSLFFPRSGLRTRPERRYVRRGERTPDH